MFPLCQRPGSVAVLDDDPVFLRVLQAHLSTRWNVAAFERGAELLTHLGGDDPFWEVDVWLQQELVAKWRAGVCSLAQGVVDYWHRQTERFACTRVCLIDYRLQGCTGLDVLRNVGKWEGRKVLVTGHSDANLQARATGTGLIDGFLSKTGLRLLPQLIELIERFQVESDPRLDRLWRSTLSPDQLAALERPGLTESVRAALAPDVIEYIVLSDPFGILCLDASGKVGWLALSMEGGAGVHLSDAPLRAALQIPGIRSQHAAAQWLGKSGLAGVYFHINAEPDLELPVGYGRWLRRQQLAAPHRLGTGKIEASAPAMDDACGGLVTKRATGRGADASSEVRGC